MEKYRPLPTFPVSTFLYQGEPQKIFFLIDSQCIGQQLLQWLPHSRSPRFFGNKRQTFPVQKKEEKSHFFPQKFENVLLKLQCS